MIEALVSLLIVVGAAFTFIGSLGLVRLRDFYTRLHGPSKATTLGVGSLLIASMLYFGSQGRGLSLREALVTLFLFITAPVSAHLLSKAALHLRLRSLAPVPGLVDAAGPTSDGADSVSMRGSGGRGVGGQDR